MGGADEADFIKKYWFGMHLETDWKVGSPWKLVFPDGRLADEGEVAECDPPRRLALRWRHKWKPELAAEGEAFCVIELEPVEGAVKLTISHSIARTELEADRSRLRRLAAHPLQPQVAARDREDDSAADR